MNNMKVVLAGLVIVVVGVFVLKGNKNTYAAIGFDGEIYSHVETTEVNNVANHFFTPDGIDPSVSAKFIQISDYGHPDLTERHVSMLRRQLSATMSLKPLEAGSSRYFGMFQNQHPIYAIETNDAFVIYSIEEGFVGDGKTLRSQADEVLDAMAAIQVPR